MRTLLTLLALIVAAVPLEARTYSTSFPLTENPISENGNWINGATNGISWHDVRTTTNLAFGTDSGGTSDSTALVTGTWGNSQTVQATVRIVASNSGVDEVELR